MCNFHYMEKFEIYDIVTRSSYLFSLEEAKDYFGIPKPRWSELKNNEVIVLYKRFCLLKNKKHLVKTIIDLSDMKEYECLTPASIAIHFPEFKKKKIGMISSILNEAAKFRSIDEKVFCLKGFENQISSFNLSHLKNRNSFPENLARRKLNEKIRRRLSCRFNQAIKTVLVKKGKSILNFMGCSVKDFLIHLESKFTTGMSWDNYGAGRGCWHIDHIKPCLTFNLTSEEEQKKCFHYTNLRPLWAEDNWRRPKDGSDIV